MFCFSAAEEIDSFLQISLLCFICGQSYISSHRTYTRGLLSSVPLTPVPTLISVKKMHKFGKPRQAIPHQEAYISWLLRDQSQVSPVYTCHISFLPFSAVAQFQLLNPLLRPREQEKKLLHFRVKLSLSGMIFLSSFLRLVNIGLTIGYSSPYFLFFKFWLISAVWASCTHILKTADYLSPDFAEIRTCRFLLLLF